MALIYTPSNFPYTQVRMPVFGKAQFGMDTASVVWGGPATKVDAFLKSLVKGTTLPAFSGFHPAYSRMFLISWTNNEDPAFPLVTLSYLGLLNGTLPEPLISSGIGTGSTSATSGDSGSAEDQRTWEIVFNSPTRTYQYITEGRPTGPKFNDYKGGPVDAPSIIQQSIRDGNGRPRGNAGGISLSGVAQLSGIDSQPVAYTPYYEVTETWQGVFSMTS